MQQHILWLWLNTTDQIFGLCGRKHVLWLFMAQTLPTSLVDVIEVLPRSFSNKGDTRQIL